MTHNSRWRQRTTLALALALCAGALRLVEPGAQAQPPAAAAAQSTLTPAQRAAVARALARVAVRDLRRQTSPSDVDFRIAATLLEQAVNVDPQPELIRRWIDAGDAAGDDAAVERATRRLIVADPSDTVAQLRLVSTLLRRSQTAQERLAATIKLAKPPAGTKAIDASVRSRLALDGALLARELGDDRQFVELLTLAAQLDATNKDAAVLALTYAMSGTTTPVEQMELLSNVLLSDPLDPAAHRQVRDLLASVGAFQLADRFQTSMQRILTVANVGSEMGERVEALTLQWRLKGAGAVIETLNRDLAAARYQQERAFDSTKADLKDLRRADEVRLNVLAEEVRLAAAIATDNQDMVELSLTEMGASVSDMRTQAANATSNVEDARLTVDQADVTLAFWLLLANKNTQTLTPRRDELMEYAQREGLAPALAAWMRYRGVWGEGDGAPVEAARADEAWGLLLQAEQEQDPKAKAALWRTLEESQPLSALGALAGELARKREPGARHPARDGVERAARAIPTWVDSMATSPFLFQRLSIEPQRPSASALEPMAFDLIVRNLSSVPLGVGEGRAIVSRFLVGPTLQLGNDALSAQATPEVVNIGSRLRLAQGEQVRLTLWMDDTPVGWLAGTGSRNSQVLRLRALQGFITDANGVRRAGPGCLDSSSGSMIRSAIPQSSLDVDAIATQIVSAGGGAFDDFRALMIACRARLLTMDEADQPQAMLTLGDALAKAYPAWSVEQRLAALGELPTVLDLPAITMSDPVGMAALDAVAAQETDPRVIPWVIATRVRDGASPIVERAQQAAELAPFVEAWKVRHAVPAPAGTP